MGVIQNLRDDAVGVLALLILGVGLADIWMDVLPGVPSWVVFAVGFAVVLPIVAIALGESREGTGDRSTASADDEDEETPLERLKRRYAGGEIDEAEFERRLERLLETEDESAAADYVERTGRAREDEPERE